TPAAADSMIEALRSMYRWTCERGICDVNPAIGVARIDKGRGGAKPWTKDDIKVCRDIHPEGTTAHLCLTPFMFTACRIGDAVVLGRANEFERGGIRGLGRQPKRKGSAKVEIPMLPPLYRATRAATVQGPTHLSTKRGRPFSAPDALGQTLRRGAGLEGRSSNGVRKAAGHLPAQAGYTQYQIMSIHGHTQARTSKAHTKGIERWRLAADAIRPLEATDWQPSHMPIRHGTRSRLRR
ncbi:MAG: site-specific integrase, partial [Pseudomonadota bacterium]